MPCCANSLTSKRRTSSFGFRHHSSLGLVTPATPTPRPNLEIDPAACLRRFDYMVNHICDSTSRMWATSCRSSRALQGGGGEPLTLLRTPAELRALQLTQRVPQATHLRQRLVALGNRRVSLRARRRDQRMQRFDVGRKLMCDLVHASTKPDSRTVVIRPRAGDSKSRGSS